MCGSLVKGVKRKVFFRNMDEKAHDGSRTEEQKKNKHTGAAYIYFFEYGESELWPEWILMHITVSLFFFESRIYFVLVFLGKSPTEKNVTAELFSIVFIFFPGKPRVVRAEKIKNSASPPPRGKKLCEVVSARGKFSGGTFCGKWSLRRRRTYLPFPSRKKKRN